MFDLFQQQPIRFGPDPHRMLVHRGNRINIADPRQIAETDHGNLSFPIDFFQFHADNHAENIIVGTGNDGSEIRIFPADLFQQQIRLADGIFQHPESPFFIIHDPGCPHGIVIPLQPLRIILLLKQQHDLPMSAFQQFAHDLATRLIGIAGGEIRKNRFPHPVFEVNHRQTDIRQQTVTGAHDPVDLRSGKLVQDPVQIARRGTDQTDQRIVFQGRRLHPVRLQCNERMLDIADESDMFPGEKSMPDHNRPLPPAAPFQISFRGQQRDCFIGGFQVDAEPVRQIIFRGEPRIQLILFPVQFLPQLPEHSVYFVSGRIIHFISILS